MAKQDIKDFTLDKFGFKVKIGDEIFYTIDTNGGFKQWGIVDRITPTGRPSVVTSIEPEYKGSRECPKLGRFYLAK